MLVLESSKLQQIQQRYVMALFYFSTQGWCWTNKLNWLSSFDVCRWEHVLCSGGLVQKIGIPTNNLVGTLSSELGQLSNSLDRLDLGQYRVVLFEVSDVSGFISSLISLSKRMYAHDNRSRWCYCYCYSLQQSDCVHPDRIWPIDQDGKFCQS